MIYVIDTPGFNRGSIKNVGEGLCAPPFPNRRIYPVEKEAILRERERELRRRRSRKEKAQKARTKAFLQSLATEQGAKEKPKAKRKTESAPHEAGTS